MQFHQRWIRAGILHLQKSVQVEVTHCHCLHSWNAPPTALFCSRPLTDLHKQSRSINVCQWVPLFPHGWIQWHTFISYTLPCQTSFCKTPPLLPSVVQPQNELECWWEGSNSTAILPTFTSDHTSQRKIGGITFGAAHVLLCSGKWVNDCVVLICLLG